ncbi:lipopolysaccharide export system permease protein [Mucilaginibacter pineti]|uniref:Lipopolysaccharide export system permease protein n=1 Tax=Mucilaginibacter pineti TaxID=1391627 RepID=A0A1G7HYE3_9SPHI|nr:LptF/LptG family permease [Mucilaginibacter pineti]SDF05425.1 lipopolysaccharide export system permease protein [Mucilaginibacter pineti]
MIKAFLHEHLKVIDRFIIKKYLGTFAFTLGVFVVISVVFDISEHLDNFTGDKSTLHDIVFQYYAGFIPFYLNLLSPLINFLAVILFTAKMANQTEIIPILSGKASFNRFLRPYFISSTIIFIISLFANVYLIPYTNHLKNGFENVHFHEVDPTKSEVHMQLDKHTFVYLQTYDPVVHTGYQFIMEKFNGDTLREKLIAQRINFDSVKKVWSLKSYSVKYINGLKEKLLINQPQKDTVLDMHPSDFIVYDNVYTAMSLSDLNKDIDKEKLRRPEVLNEIYFEKFHRFVYPMSAYVLTIMGVALSSRKVRGGVGLPLGIGILLCFAYIIVEKFAIVFSIKGGMTPLIAVVIPNILFGVFGYYLLLKAPK